MAQEKPYDFVPFPSGVDRKSPEGHARFVHLTGTLEATLVAHRPVQVASGFLDVVTVQGQEVVVAQGTRRGRVPILPGSSLKGAVRSLVEALSPSCVRVVGGRSRKALPAPLAPCSDADRLCPACRLFGMSGPGRENYGGQVSVEDAVMVSGQPVLVRTPLLWAPARSLRGLPERYMAGDRAVGRKFYFHGMPARGTDARIAAGSGSAFETRIHFENLTEGELGLLLAALGQHPRYPFLLKVGAGKPVGMGSLEVRLRGVRLMGEIRSSGRAGARSPYLTGEPLAEAIQEWVQAAGENGLLDGEALEEVHRILRRENLSRPSPEGPY